MRAAAVLAATVVLLWLTLPALVSPASVAATIRDEDRLHATWLGEAAAHGILLRALGWIGQASEASRQVAPADSPRLDPLSARLTAATDAVVQTPYIQGVRTLARLAVYRLAALAEWLALGFPLLLAATIDGAVMRAVQLSSFAHVSPVLFGIGLHGTLAVLACTALALLLPLGVHPLVWGASVGGLAATLRITVTNFHRVR
jgi:hypothetical protein